VTRLLLALFLGWMCVLVTCASGPLGGPATITAARPAKVQAHRGPTTEVTGGGMASTGFPVAPRPTPLLVAVIGLLLALAVAVTLRASDDAPEPHRRWRAPDPPRRGPPLLLAP
jgi:hypothetical protein